MMKKDLTLVILAAGMGSRFGGLKQVEPVGPNGEFIIDYSIYDAIQAGFTKVVFIIKEEMYDLFRETVGKRIEGKIQVEYAFQKIDDVPEFVNIPITCLRRCNACSVFSNTSVVRCNNLNSGTSTS